MGRSLGVGAEGVEGQPTAAAGAVRRHAYLPRVHHLVEVRGQHGLHQLLPVGNHEAVAVRRHGVGVCRLDLLDVDELQGGLDARVVVVHGVHGAG